MKTVQEHRASELTEAVNPPIMVAPVATQTADSIRKLSNTIKTQEHTITAMGQQIQTLQEERDNLLKKNVTLSQEIDLQKMLRSAILGSTVDHLTALSQTIKIEMRR